MGARSRRQLGDVRVSGLTVSTAVRVMARSSKRTFQRPGHPPDGDRPRRGARRLRGRRRCAGCADTRESPRPLRPPPTSVERSTIPFVSRTARTLPSWVPISSTLTVCAPSSSAAPRIGQLGQLEKVVLRSRRRSARPTTSSLPSPTRIRGAGGLLLETNLRAEAQPSRPPRRTRPGFARRRQASPVPCRPGQPPHRRRAVEGAGYRARSARRPGRRAAAPALGDRPRPVRKPPHRNRHFADVAVKGRG